MYTKTSYLRYKTIQKYFGGWISNLNVKKPSSILEIFKKLKFLIRDGFRPPWFQFWVVVKIMSVPFRRYLRNDGWLCRNKKISEKLARYIFMQILAQFTHRQSTVEHIIPIKISEPAMFLNVIDTILDEITNKFDISKKLWSY